MPPFYIMGMNCVNTDFVKSIGKNHMLKIVQIYILLWMKLGIFSDLDLGGQGDFRVRLLWLNIRQPFSWWSQASLSVKWYEMSIGWNYATDEWKWSEQCLAQSRSDSLQCLRNGEWMSASPVDFNRSILILIRQKTRPCFFTATE